MKFVMTLLLILAGCSSAQKYNKNQFEGAFRDSTSGYVIDEMDPDIETCDSYSNGSLKENCYNNVARLLRIKLKQKYEFMTDKQMHKYMAGLSEEASSIHDMGIKLENKIRKEEIEWLRWSSSLPDHTKEELLRAYRDEVVPGSH